MNSAIIGLGSNIRPHANIQKAKKILDHKLTVIKESTFRITEPIGGNNQPRFINGAVFLETCISIAELKFMLKAIETALGRKKSKNKNAPRTIDLDILVWNNQIVDPDVYTRGFLKDSIQELFPGLIV